MAARVGVSWWVISGIRISLALLAGIVINLLWGGSGQSAEYGLISTSNNVVNGPVEIFIQAIKAALIWNLIDNRRRN